MSRRWPPSCLTKWSGNAARPCQQGNRSRDLRKPLTYRGDKSRVKFCDCWRSSGEEQLPCKQWVGGSNPPASASFTKGVEGRGASGEIPKWPKGADCKSAGGRLRGFKSSSPHHLPEAGKMSGPGMSGRERGNSSAVERQPSKLGVAGSNPVSRSTVPGPR